MMAPMNAPPEHSDVINSFSLADVSWRKWTRWPSSAPRSRSSCVGEEPRLAAFVDLVARRSGGRVVAPDLDGLGAAVVSDYLRGRRQR